MNHRSGRTIIYGKASSSAAKSPFPRHSRCSPSCAISLQSISKMFLRCVSTDTVGFIDYSILQTSRELRRPLYEFVTKVQPGVARVGLFSALLRADCHTISRCPHNMLAWQSSGSMLHATMTSRERMNDMRKINISRLSAFPIRSHVRNASRSRGLAQRLVDQLAAARAYSNAELMNAIWHGSLSWPEKRAALALVLANHAGSPTIHRQLLIWLEVASRAEYVIACFASL